MYFKHGLTHKVLVVLNLFCVALSLLCFLFYCVFCHIVLRCVVRGELYNAMVLLVVVYFAIVSCVVVCCVDVCCVVVCCVVVCCVVV